MGYLIFDSSVALWLRVLLWFISTGVFTIALWVGLNFAKIKLEKIPFAIVATLCSFLAIIPVAGEFVAFILGTYLIYQMSAEDDFIRPMFAMFICRAIIVAVFVFGPTILLEKINRKPDPNIIKMRELLEQEKNSQQKNPGDAVPSHLI